MVEVLVLGAVIVVLGGLGYLDRKYLRAKMAVAEVKVEMFRKLLTALAGREEALVRSRITADFRQIIAEAIGEAEKLEADVKKEVATVEKSFEVYIATLKTLDTTDVAELESTFDSITHVIEGKIKNLVAELEAKVKKVI
jgi:regulator of protease activity HflC (stomatin/prohibitin superfamily)